MNKFVEIRRELHGIPELGFQEYKTQERLLRFIRNLPQENIVIEIWRTGIFVFVRGENPTKTIGYRADIDGLPIREETNLKFRSQHEGCMHACGHDFHMSIALGVLENIVVNRIQDDVLFMFQPAEEGPGGAELMVRNEFFKKHMPDMVMALHVSPKDKVDVVAVRTGIMFANTTEVHVTFTGKGGHAAFPHEANDMVIASANFIMAVQSIVARNVNPLDSVVVTFGEMKAGTANNIIAGQSKLVGTIRTLSVESMLMAKDRIKEIARGVATGFGCDADVEFKNDYVSVENDTGLALEFIRFLGEESECAYVPCETVMAGEDFGYMLREVPGLMFWLGVDSEFGLHHSKFNPNEDAIGVGIDLVSGYLRWLDRMKNE